MDSQTSSSSGFCSSDWSWKFGIQVKMDELEQAPTGGCVNRRMHVHLLTVLSHLQHMPFKLIIFN